MTHVVLPEKMSDAAVLANILSVLENIEKKLDCVLRVTPRNDEEREDGVGTADDANVADAGDGSKIVGEESSLGSGNEYRIRIIPE